MTTRRAIVAPSLLAAEAGALIVLPPAVAHYVEGVLRLRAGDALELCDGAGAVVGGVLERGPRGASPTLRVAEVHRESAPPGPAITLFQAVGKGDKLEVVFRAATELGVRRLVPVRTARAVAERSGKADRWRLVVEDAIRVSGRAWAPEVEPIRGLAEVLARPRAPLAMALDGAGSRALGDVLRSVSGPAAVDVLVGPEGGFADDERHAIDAAGWVRASLGGHTLRTETAGVAIVAIVGHVLGHRQ